MSRIGLPYAEQPPLDELLADAAVVSDTYPVSRLERERVADRMEAVARWLEISEELSSRGSLSRPFLD